MRYLKWIYKKLFCSIGWHWMYWHTYYGKNIEGPLDSWIKEGHCKVCDKLRQRLFFDGNIPDWLDGYALIDEEEEL